MDFIDMLLTEYVVSGVGTILGLVLTIGGAWWDKGKITKVGISFIAIFGALFIIVFIRNNFILNQVDGTLNEQIEVSEAPAEPETESETEPENREVGETKPESSETGGKSNPPIETKKPTYDAVVVSKIEEVSYTISPIAEAEISIPQKDVAMINGIVQREDEYIDYPITPDTDGIYRFEFSNVPDGTDLAMLLLNEGGEVLDRKSGMDNGDGMSKDLIAGKKYYLRVEQYSNFGTYTLKVGQQKPLTDITYYTKVNDSIQYKDQENRYIFVPMYEGTHRFEFSNVPDGTDFSIYIYNTGWEQIDYKTGLDNGDGITFSFSQIKPYYIVVEQYNNIGTYTLNLGDKKAICDISGYNKVTDSVQYTAQKNDYKYVPDVSGNYRFEFDGVPDGTDLSMYIYNSGWEQIDYKTGLDNGEGITYNLTAGNAYYIQVRQYNNVGKYTLKIGEKKAIVDITEKRAVADSIQYYMQENDYSYMTSRGGEHTIKMSSMPAGMYANVYVYNSGWEQIDYATSMDEGDALKVYLETGKTYYIRVKYNSAYGEYTLKVS